MSSIALMRRLVSARPRSEAAVDAAIAVAVLVGSLGLLAHGGFDLPGSASRPVDLTGVALVAASAIPLVCWRRSPLGVFALTGALGVALTGVGYRVDLVLGPCVALYLLAAGRERSGRTWRTAVVVTALFLALMAATAAAQRTFPGLELLHTGLAWSVAWFAGERTRLRREHIGQLSERALRAEREMERERRLATVEERARIARDLHDSAGHAISLIAVRAGAARLRHGGDPERMRLALEAIEEVARSTVDDLDGIVGTLRQDDRSDGSVESPPGLASLDTLLGHHSAAGLEMTCRESGDRRPLAVAVDQAAYRILQEALTNAARHGAGSASIELRFEDAAIELTVTNPVPSDRRTRDGGGHGVVGMRERAAVLGGTLEAGQCGELFRVRARIPYGGHRT